jgi:hypothetical protein
MVYRVASTSDRSGLHVLIAKGDVMRKYLAAALLLLLVTARPSSAQTPLGELIENFTLALTPGNLTLVLGPVGAKFNVAQNLLMSGNVLFPLNNAGLRDRATFTFGLDYAF